VSAPIYLGDEVGAAGYRLAGARVRTPPRGEARAALERALSEAPLVLVSATVAAGIGEPILRLALAATAPLVLVVPDVNGTTPLPDVAVRMREQLGLEA
jgi:vacuolar-type H+-ATPase subunit F/Vma7